MKRKSKPQTPLKLIGFLPPGPDPPATRLPDVGQGWRAGLSYRLNKMIRALSAL